MDEIWCGKVAAVEETYDEDNVNTPNKYGVRPLQVACLKVYPNVEVVICLLKLGASLEFEVEPGVMLLQAVATSANKNLHQGPVLSCLEKTAVERRLRTNLPVNPTVTKPTREVIGDRPVFRTQSGKTKA